MSELVSPSPSVDDFRASDIEPTIVTSRPSRIQTVPSPITMTQCHRAQGSRSSLAGMSVLIWPVSTLLAMAPPPCGCEARSRVCGDRAVDRRTRAPATACVAAGSATDGTLQLGLAHRRAATHVAALGLLVELGLGPAARALVRTQAASTRRRQVLGRG